MKIRLQTIDDVKEFVNICSTYEEDIDYIVGRYIIDAKSILGIFSVDLRHGGEVKIHSSNVGNILRFEEDIKRWAYNESSN